MAQGKVSSLRVILLGAILVFTGSVGFYTIPGMISDDAEGTHWVNSVYCAVMTLTTVGFGDICPGKELSNLGRLFIVALSLSGLGMFCGPIMDLTSSWKEKLPIGGEIALLTLTVTTTVFIFSHVLEEMSQSEAAYFSIITGTTIGYGDVTATSDVGKLAAAFYAIFAINVVASVLQPAMRFLLTFCMEQPDVIPTSKKQKKPESKTISAKTTPNSNSQNQTTITPEEDTQDSGRNTKKKKVKKKKKTN